MTISNTTKYSFTGSQVKSLPTHIPKIAVTDTDPGEGSALDSNNFVAVTGGASIIDIFYPVGSYYETSDTSFDPNVSWGGTWVEDSAGRVTVSQDSGTFITVGSTGGEEEHTLTVAEMPRHRHYGGVRWSTEAGASFLYGSNGTGLGSQYDSSVGWAGNGNAHNNLQPYIVVKRWHRTE